MKYDYISILAGGVCPIQCIFCVGNSIRKDVPPHFANMNHVKHFVKNFSNLTEKLSISGSTSDPLFVSNLDEVISVTRDKFNLSLHTCNIEELVNRPASFLSDFYRLTLSIHSIPDEDVIDFIERNREKVRVSIVYYEDTKPIIDNMAFFDEIPSKSFTIRKNIFNPQEPDLKNVSLVDSVFNQPIYQYGDKRIAVWDFADANKYIDAIYLWSDGLVRRQCYWYRLHDSKP